MLRGLVNPIVVIAIAIIVVLVLTLIFSVVKGKSWKELRLLFTQPERRIKTYLLWVSIYVAFLFFWLPHNGFYRLFYLPAIFLLIGQLLSGKFDERQPTYRLALFAAVLALSNLVFFIYPHSRVEKNPPLSLAVEMNSVWPPGTIVYFRADNSDNNLVAYFNPAIEWRPLSGFAQMDAELKQVYAEGNRAWLEASAIDELRSSREGNDWLDRHGRPETWHERKARGYNLKFIQVGP